MSHVPPNLRAASALVLMLLAVFGMVSWQQAASGQPRAVPPAQATNAVITPYRPGDAVAYAQQNLFTLNNSDGCYFDEGSNCRPQPGFLFADGSHFVGCALKAGGIEKLGSLNLCAREQSSSITAQELLGAIGQYITPVDPTKNMIPQAGDIVMFQVSSSSPPCQWGIMFSPNQFYAHSVDDAYTVNNPVYRCPSGLTITPTFYRVLADTYPPEAPILGDITEPYNGGPVTVVWNPAQDVQNPALPTEQVSGVVSYRIIDTNTGATITTSPQSPVALAVDMCSYLRVGIIAIDTAGNESTPAQATITRLQQGDVNADGVVDTADIEWLKANPADPRADLTGDGVSDLDDQLWIIQHVGESCTLL